MATHGCTGNPCTICGNGWQERTFTSNVDLQLARNSIWSPFRPSPFEHDLTARPEQTITTTNGTGVEFIVCPCNTLSDFPQRCPYHDPMPLIQPQVHVELHPGWVRVQPPLSDDDVARIAKKVVELTEAERKNKRAARKKPAPKQSPARKRTR